MSLVIRFFGEKQMSGLHGLSFLANLPHSTVLPSTLYTLKNKLFLLYAETFLLVPALLKGSTDFCQL